ncbi:alpha-terpineol synthase, chloroplastic-like isoform X2 [Phragmites australis]|uniref:alpha-terpineol synthase, chloroplastic-like isoform X2 n=1 Tax=Phragmites australis TaxID=29695 RepID=UPI002D79D8C9|nr:alpha-terpineol synthase, chloroplastic-like isoform X2 [Phragmites australis]
MIERADQLKKEVSKTIAASSNCSLYERMHLIEVLEHLCLDHLFEQEINAVLTQISYADVGGCDLQTVALWFYLLRKHGYGVSPDVLAKFSDEQGSFAAKNPKDLLNLYNAAYLRTSGELILDEAICFTKRCLESIVPHMEGPLAREMKCALEIPIPRRVRIYEAKYYISTYGKETKGDEVIMELAKLNFNLMQLQHNKEVKIVTRWWNGLELQSRLSFARDRVVECYFWIVGVYFEPSFSRGRIILTKVLAIVSILDDTYDVYGTSQECELFTKCVESWDPKVAHDLPENMKFIFRKVLDTFLSIENELAPEEKYRMSYLKNFIVDLVRAYNKEVKWREEGYIPATVKEHLEVSARSGACHLLSCASFVGMGDIATKETFDWVQSMPKIVKALCIILRLSDDLKSYEATLLFNIYLLMHLPDL